MKTFQSNSISRSLALVAILIVAGLGTVSAQDSFEDFKKQQNESFNDFKTTTIADYEAYKEQERKAFEAFKEQMKQRWGDFKERTQKEWVEYNETGEIRSSVDFEEGKGTVEIILEEGEDEEEAKEKLKAAVEETFTKKASKREFPMEEEPNKEVTSEPVLEDQLPVETQEEKKELAEKLVEEEAEVKTVKGEDGKERRVVKVNFELAPDHLQKRAVKVQQIVEDFAKQYEISPALVYAIIHTESYFNPVARSHVGALGLMQVVPTSGGRDAYRHVFKEDGVPTEEFLFDPKNNVNLGSGYVEVLRQNYFRKIEDPVTREYMVVCAYNTGAGNVAKAYNGTFNIRKAIPLINAKTAQQNYDHLLANLPYDETKGYLKKVTDRKKMYEEWMK